MDDSMGTMSKIGSSCSSFALAQQSLSIGFTLSGFKGVGLTFHYVNHTATIAFYPIDGTVLQI